MGSSADCPFCHLTVPSSQLEWHANSHFEEDENEQVAMDMELARQLQLAPSSPSPHSLTNQVDSDMQFETTLLNIEECSTSMCDDRTRGNGEEHIDEKISRLIGLQMRSNFYKVEEGLMILLRKCLELEAENSTSILSGYVDHFQCVKSEDVGWGCGWRNIQMLSSHLLMRRQEAREVLFGGSEFVPDIPSLQRWLEIAWERGFDALGSDHFNHNIYGSTNWIGTTECAALFRSFGLRARIVDFGPKEIESLILSVPGSSLGAQTTKINNGGKRKVVQIYGPMDRFLLGRDRDGQAGSGSHDSSRYSNIHLGDDLGSKSGGILVDDDKYSTRKSKGQQVLIDWVWNYFSDESLSKYGQQRVIVSDKPPLYFQHDGHSRTIVGIQVKHRQNGMPQYNLLILDPGHATTDLKRSLKENVGWQGRIKRGVHTLKKPQYQLCYIDPGISSREEMEQLKTIESIFLEF